MSKGNPNVLTLDKGSCERSQRQFQSE